MPSFSKFHPPPVFKDFFLWTLSFCSIVVLIGLSLRDTLWTQLLYENPNAQLGEVMRRSLFEGDAPGGSDPSIILFLGALILYCRLQKAESLPKLKAWKPYLGFIVFSGFVVGIGIVQGMKWSIGRARPHEVFSEAFSYTPWYSLGSHYITEGMYFGSFPSGHTSSVMMLMTLAYIAYAAPGASISRKVLGAVWGVFVLVAAALMALARSMTGHHWVTDTFGVLFPLWGILHSIYFYLLNIPEQALYLRTRNTPAHLKFWELRLCAYCILSILGIVAIILGVRSLQFQNPPWLIVLALLGSALSMHSVKQAQKLHDNVFSSIHIPDDV